MKKHFVVIIISFIILMATMILPRPNVVNSDKDMLDLRFGYPVAFISQDVRTYSPPYPHTYYGLGLPQEFPIDILWGQFLISWLILIAIGEIFILLNKHKTT